jgi:hypothetical protein
MMRPQTRVERAEIAKCHHRVGTLAHVVHDFAVERMDDHTRAVAPARTWARQIHNAVTGDVLSANGGVHRKQEVHERPPRDGLVRPFAYVARPTNRISAGQRYWRGRRTESMWSQNVGVWSGWSEAQ